MWWCDIPNGIVGDTIVPARVPASLAIASAARWSVPRRPFGPCCSVLPMGTRMTSFVLRYASMSAHVRSSIGAFQAFLRFSARPFDGLDGQVGDGWNDVVRVPERLGGIGVGDGQDGHPRAAGGFDSGVGILDDQAFFRLERARAGLFLIQLGQGPYEPFRVRLAGRHVLRRDDDAKQAPETRALEDAVDLVRSAPETTASAYPPDIRQTASAAPG